jgi:hypothetical protein
VFSLAAASATAALLLTGSSGPASAQAALPAETREILMGQLEYYSTVPQLLIAEMLGVTEIQGKPINPESETTHNSPERLFDVPIGFDPIRNENEPTIATSPKDKKKLVVGSHRSRAPLPLQCVAFTSSDGGATWSAGVVMPQLTPASMCSDPVLAYAPDGSRVYYGYLDIKLPSVEVDVLVSHSDDDGQTWSPPVIALKSVAGAIFFDKLWIATPLDESNFVYVTATQFGLAVPGSCHIVFTRSTDSGESYAAPVTLDTAAVCNAFAPGSTVLVQGSRPSGGKQGNVLVGWYHSDTDGVRTGRFRIRTRHSADFGKTFEPTVDAVTDSFEANFFKGPGIPRGCYERWWGAMFPDVEIDASGSAHIAYTHDPVAGQTTAEEGDIRYITSASAPYTVWSPPITVNDDGTATAQGYVAIDTQTQQTGQSANLHAAWMDSRLSSSLAKPPQCTFDPAAENLFYDIFYSTKPPGEGWRENVRVTAQSSISDFNFLGDYIDLSTDNGSLFAVWTDRRDKTSIMDPEDDVWGSRTHREH